MGTLARVRTWLARTCAHRMPTMFGEARVYLADWGPTRIRVLDVEGTYQSATYVDDHWCDVPFPYLALYDCVFATEHPARELCMLGGGGFAYPKHVVAHHPSARIDVVEVDPAIMLIARKWFYLDRLISTYGIDENGRLRIICDDALAHLRKCARTEKRYDAILNDCFAAGSADASLVSPEAIELCKKCLHAEGLYVTNLISAFEGADAEPLMELVALLATEFEHVQAIPCNRTASDQKDNMVVVASMHDCTLPNAIRLYDTLP